MSILANVAEGAGKTSPADKRRHYTIARGSSTESAALLDACHRLKLVPESDHRRWQRNAHTHCCDAGETRAKLGEALTRLLGHGHGSLHLISARALPSRDAQSLLRQVLGTTRHARHQRRRARAPRQTSQRSWDGRGAEDRSEARTARPLPARPVDSLVGGKRRESLCSLLAQWFGDHISGHGNLSQWS